jgi:hypothetical protein
MWLNALSYQYALGDGACFRIPNVGCRIRQSGFETDLSPFKQRLPLVYPVQACEHQTLGASRGFCHVTISLIFTGVSDKDMVMVFAPR